MDRNRNMLFALGIVVMGITGTQAADQAATSKDRWEVTLAPYVFGASLSGDMVVRGRGAEIDLSSSDILDNLEFGFMGMGMARKGNWGFAGDIIYMELGVTSDMPPADIDPTLGVLTFQGIRRLSKYADLTFGGRWSHLDGRISFKPPINVDVKHTKDWVDPVAGIVLRTPEDHRWHATLIADVGGFGVGSDFTWQVFPSAGVDLTQRVSLEFGWRLLDTKYETGSGSDRFEYDTRLQGPVMGLAFKL